MNGIGIQTSSLQLKQLANNKTQLTVTFTTRKGNRQEWPVKADLLDAELAKRSLLELNGLEVDFELIDGHPAHIRLKGSLWQEPVAQSQPFQRASQQQRNLGKQKQTQQRYTPNRDGQQPQNYKRDFHNPYNFIPAPPRLVHGELSDRAPTGHHAYHDKLWSGRIAVKLTTVTQLLLPDAARATGGDHKMFPVRVDAKGHPYLPPTSLKGMLRAEYEVATNSRFGVFRGHDDRLAYRAQAKGGAQVIPARVTDNGQFIELLPGFTEIGSSSTPPIMFAAALPHYGSHAPKPKKSHDLSITTGQAVWAELELWEHHVSPRYKTHWEHNYDYWRVLAVQSGAGSQPTSVSPLSSPRNRPQPNRERRQSFHQPKKQGCWIKGYLLINNNNIDGKHDERLFFVDPNHSQQGKLKITLSDDHKKQWRNLVKNYQEEHQKEIEQGITKPSALRDKSCKWSRHIEAGKEERELSPGTLFYVSVVEEDNIFIINELYPVMISRVLYSKSPTELLHLSLHPAKKLEELSPADRVFGWVNPDGPSAWKGQLRIGPVTCKEGAAAMESFDGHGLPLAILGEPKPQQARFYAADTVQGQPLPDGKEKDYGYQQGRSLRGRKVYPHHVPKEQEYRRLNDERDTQNRSILGWIKPNKEFTFDIHLSNLSAVELGALLWLLDPINVPHHRLGGGKPLGFGSVKLEIEECELADGAAWRDYYCTLGKPSWSDEKSRNNLIADYKKAVLAAYPATDFEQVSFIKAFQMATCGFTDGLPVHYPRTQDKPSAESKVYEWFVSNEKEGRDGGLKLSLPALGDPDPGLPYKPQS